MAEMSDARLDEIDRRYGAGGSYTGAPTKQDLRVALIELVDEVRRQRRADRTAALECATAEQHIEAVTEPDQLAAPENERLSDDEFAAWQAAMRPTPEALEAENKRLWERAAEADLARVQAELRAAKLRLVLSSALSVFTEKRRSRDELRSGWVKAARVEQWRRVFEETRPTTEQLGTEASKTQAAARTPTWRGQTTRYLCPITGCEWHHDSPDVPDFPWQWKGSIEETVAAISMDQAQQTDKVISDHAATHPVVEWFREVRQQQNRADAAEREVAEKVGGLEPAGYEFRANGPFVHEVDEEHANTYPSGWTEGYWPERRPLYAGAWERVDGADGATRDMRET